MITDIVLLLIALIALVIASITDLKTREVPDWLSYSVIIIGVGIRGIYSLATFNYMYLIYGLIGLGIFVGVAYAMFYSRQWGGGDAKLLMGIGVLIGLPLSFKQFPLLCVFFINLLVAGAFWGLGWVIWLGVRHRKKILREFRKGIREKQMRVMRWSIGILCLALLVVIFILVRDSVIRFWFVLLIVLIYVLFYLFIFIKAVEKIAMFVYVSPEKLTVGDWIAKDYYDGKKRICGPKDLGIEKKQIKRLLALKKIGKIKKIKIKLGIPFVPSFLIGYIITLFFGAWWMFLV